MPRFVVALLTFCVLAFSPPAAPAQDAPAQDAPPKFPSLKKVELNQQALDKLGWKLGVQAYTFRKMSLYETIDVTAAMGLKHIELYPGQTTSPQVTEKFNHDARPEQIAAVIEKLAGAGVVPVSYGVVGLSKDEAASRKVFDFAQKLGIKTIVSEPPPDAFDTIEKLVNEYGINVAIHDHPKPARYWTPDDVLEVCKDRPKTIGACADIGHWYRSGLVPLECVKKLEGRIISSHLKDRDEKMNDVPVGTGKVDVKAILAEIRRQGARDVMFAIEYETSEGDELIANVIKSIEFFNATATELAGK